MRGQGAQLEYQRAEPVFQAIERRLHEFAHRGLRVEKEGIGLPAAAGPAAHHRVGDDAGCLDDETEVVGDLGRVGGVLAGRERPIERAIDADGAQQRVPGIGGQAVPGQHRFGVVTLPDQALPAGIGP